MTASGFYSHIGATGQSDTQIIGEELSPGSVKLKICGRKLLVAITGEPAGHLLLEKFQEGLARKLLHPGMRTLVDMTGFIGVVDWQAMAKLRDLAPWGQDTDHPPRTAYLVKEGGAALLVKAASALFPASEHRAFTEQAAAIAWLES
ncbi:MAG: STAS/SEC14 domain-containing protein [Rhizomicrobium sp.]